MMSHEEPHAPPGSDQPEDQPGGEEEEGDIEARTAVEALLALTSPTDYTHHTGYDDDYMMEEVAEDYELVKSGMDKEESLEEIYHTEAATTRHTTEVIFKEHINHTQHETDREVYVSGLVESSEVNQSDEGLKQLQAFVQATEGRESISPKVLEASGPAVYNLDGSLVVTVKSPSNDVSPVVGVNKVVELSVKTECDSSTSENYKDSPMTSVVMKAGTSSYKGTSATEKGSDMVINSTKDKCVKVVKEERRLSSSSLHTKRDLSTGSRGSEHLKEDLSKQVFVNPSTSSDQIVFDKTKGRTGIEIKVSSLSSDSDSDDSDGNDSDNSDSNSSSSSSDSDSSSDGSDSDGSDSDSDSDDDSKCTDKTTTGTTDNQPVKIISEGKNIEMSAVSVDKNDKKETALSVTIVNTLGKKDTAIVSSVGNTGSGNIGVSSVSRSPRISDTGTGNSGKLSIPRHPRITDTGNSGSGNNSKSPRIADIDNTGVRNFSKSPRIGEVDNTGIRNVSRSPRISDVDNTVSRTTRIGDTGNSGISNTSRSPRNGNNSNTDINSNINRSPRNGNNSNIDISNITKSTRSGNSGISNISKRPRTTPDWIDIEEENRENPKPLKTEDKNEYIGEAENKIEIPFKESKSYKHLKEQLDKVDLGGSVSISVVKTKSEPSIDGSSGTSRTAERKSSAELMSNVDKGSIFSSSDKSINAKFGANRIAERKSSGELISHVEKSSIFSSSVKSINTKSPTKKETLRKKNYMKDSSIEKEHSSTSNPKTPLPHSPIAKNEDQSSESSRSPTPTKCTVEKSQVDLVREVAVAFARQLSSIQLKSATEKLGEQKENVEESRTEVSVYVNRRNSAEEKRPVEKNDDHDQVMDEDDDDGDGVLVMAEDGTDTNEDRINDDGEDDDREEWEDTYPMPIQAEVVMSEGSESGLEYDVYDEADGPPLGDEMEELDWCKKGSELLDVSEKENQELIAYLRSFILGGGDGELVEYPPANNEVPTDRQDLTQWQLEEVRLPPFTPTVAPPPWLRLTIPPEGYRCHSCGDTFFIEASLVQHRERRSVWISLECGPCDARLTFYNRCTLKEHLREHLVKGEEVDEETVEVRSLPLQLTRLLQPILVPVPHTLAFSSKKLQRRLKGHSALNRPPVLKHIGRQGSDEGKTDHLNIIHSELKRRGVRCYLCERTYHNVRELMAHMRTDQSYSDQRVECRKCQLVLPSVCAAKAHILTHPPANTSNISVCPECGSRCEGPREFVHHLNTCGHQYRRSGVVCGQCSVCFFRCQDDFVTHWIAEHCGKSYECVVCHCTFESLVFHKCMSPGQQVLATFRCLLTCPLCSDTIQLHAQQEELDTNAKIRAHLVDHHPTVVTRVHYVYKSKFCTNAFRSKDELRAHPRP